jgi:hypothetical protein
MRRSSLIAAAHTHHFQRPHMQIRSISTKRPTLTGVMSALLVLMAAGYWQHSHAEDARAQSTASRPMASGGYEYERKRYRDTMEALGGSEGAE